MPDLHGSEISGCFMARILLDSNNFVLRSCARCNLWDYVIASLVLVSIGTFEKASVC